GSPATPGSPSCRAPSSLATFVTVGFPFVPIEATELALFGPRAHALQGFAGLVATAHRSCRHQTRDFLPVARDRDLFALLDEVEQLAELVLGFEGTDLAHRSSYPVPDQILKCLIFISKSSFISNIFYYQLNNKLFAIVFS